MEMALQAFEVACDSVNNFNEKKPNIGKNSKSFEDHLEGIRKIIEKDLNTNDKNSKMQENSAFLIQLLNLLNINVQIEDLQAAVNGQLQDADINLNADLANLYTNTEFHQNKLIQCWQEILQEFSINGDVTQDTAEIFYLAMKKAFPTNMLEIDSKEIHVLLNEILTNTKPEIEQTEDLARYSNGDKLIGEYNSSTPNLLVQDKHEKSSLEKFDIHNLIDKEENSSPTTYTRDNNVEKVFGDEHGLNNDLRNNQIIYDDKNMAESLYLDAANTSVKESAAVSQNDKISPTLFSAENSQTTEILNQLVDKMHFVLEGETQQVNIRLKPDYLGNVLIKVFTDKDKLKAELFVENTQVRDILKLHAIDFQHQIKQQGYSVSEINVYKLSDELEMGAFNQQSNSNSSYNKSKGVRSIFNKQEPENREVLIQDYYDQWGNVSRINYKV